MTSSADMIQATRRALKNGVATEDALNVLAAPYTAGSGSIQVRYPLQGLTNGTRISIGTSTFHLWSVSAASTNITVTEGVDGSPDGNYPTGTLIRVAPRWTDWEVFNELNNDLNDLSSPTNGLFAVETTDVTYNAAIRGYDLGGLSGQILDLIDVQYQTPGPDRAWPSVDQWSFHQSADATNFASGLALQINSYAYSGYAVHVIAKTSFTPFVTDTTIDVSTTGLPLTAYDLPPLGAAIRLQSGVDIERTRLDTQGDIRRADDVAVQSPGAAENALRQLRASRIMAEATRLRSLYPIRRR